MRLSGVRFQVLLLGMALALSACASGGTQQGGGTFGLAPTMTIERFLRAANQNDLDTMAGLFGTRDGPVSRNWSRREIDDRMFLFASLLRHSDYTISGEQIVPGRREEATLYNVRLVLEQGPVQVPFTMVRTRTDQWLIEEIGIERITHPNRNRP
jgi:hypothetical protein